MNYCHNCGHSAVLHQNAYCAYCLDRFYGDLGRLPRKSDPIPATDSLSVLYRIMEWS